MISNCYIPTTDKFQKNQLTQKERWSPYVLLLIMVLNHSAHQKLTVTPLYDTVSEDNDFHCHKQLNTSLAMLWKF